jgi:hypothetical protein
MPTDAGPLALPLREHWRMEVAPRGLMPHAPLLHADTLVARCGNHVVGTDADSGVRRWGVQVDPEPLPGELLVACGDVLVTDQRRPSDKTTTLVALDWDGRQVWTRELGLRVLQDAVAGSAEQLFVVGIEPRHFTQFLVELEPATGAVRARHSLTWRADALARHRAGLLVTNRHASAGMPGLYRLALDGGDATAVGVSPVERLFVTERSVLTLGAAAEAEGAATPSVESRDVDTLSVRWSAPASEAALGAEGGEVAHVDGAGEQRTLVLRDERTGTVRWRAPATPSEAVSVSFAPGLLVVRDMDGLGVYRRGDGTLLGYQEGSFSGAASGAGRLFVGHRNTVRCLSGGA